MKQGISGLDKVLANLNHEIKKMKIEGVEGLLKAGIEIRAEGQRETPVDTGNLINSWYGPTPFETEKTTVVEIGLTANYAPYVHEMVDAKFQKPESKAKFLEDPLKAMAGKLLFILGRRIGK